MTAVLDPETRFPGLPDGMAHAVAAVVEARTAGLWVLARHLRDSGCPFPARADVMAELVGRVEDEALECPEWPVGLREAVVTACADVAGVVSRLRAATR